MPDGLALNGVTGEISGTPTVDATFNFTVEVTDSSALPQTATQALALYVAPETLVITTASLPNGVQGTAYSQTVAATGGTSAIYVGDNRGGAAGRLGSQWCDRRDKRDSEPCRDVQLHGGGNGLGRDAAGSVTALSQ